MNERQRLANGERGAVLVHVAIAILALIAFSALAVDYGTLLVSRRQAQNSADAAALAGAISLAFDDPADIPRAQAAAEAAGEANQVWGAAPSIDLARSPADVRLVTCPPGPGAARHVYPRRRLSQTDRDAGRMRFRRFLRRSWASRARTCARRRPRQSHRGIR